MSQHIKIIKPTNAIALLAASLSLACSVTFANQAEQFQSAPQAKAEIRQTRVATSGDPIGRNVTFEVVNGLAIVEGDIVLGEADRLPTIEETESISAQSRGITVTQTGSLWPDGVMPYQISTALAGSSVESKINSAIDHIESRTPVLFVLRTPSNEAQYPDYVEFVSGSGCASYVGRRGGLQNIWMSTACSTGNAIHEIGHALGLYHEQTRSDRDSFVDIFWQNIRSGKEHNFEMQLSNATDLGEYDYGSIMHYGSYFFSSNGNPTIVSNNPPNTPIGQRIALSSGDIDAIGRLYSTDLRLSLSASPTLVEPGGLLTLTLNIANLQTNLARGVISVVPIPSFGAYVGASGDLWECESDADTVECELDIIEGDSASTLDIFLSTPAEGFPLVLSAEVSSFGSDTDPSNNAQQTEVIVNSRNFAPVIDQGQQFRVNKLSSVGVTFGTVTAFDYNGDTLQEFAVVSGQMKDSIAINGSTGELSVLDASMWNSDEMASFTVGVIVTDGQTASAITDIEVAFTDDAQGADGGGGGSSQIGVLEALLLILTVFTRFISSAVCCCKIRATLKRPLLCGDTNRSKSCMRQRAGVASIRDSLLRLLRRTHRSLADG
ncbi:MAG: M12 family metallopeptidase [Pseudomonadota bacterium]